MHLHSVFTEFSPVRLPFSHLQNHFCFLIIGESLTSSSGNISHGSRGAQVAARLDCRLEHRQHMGSQWPLFKIYVTQIKRLHLPQPRGPPANGDSGTNPPALFSLAWGSPGLAPRRLSICGGRGQAGHATRGHIKSLGVLTSPSTPEVSSQNS